MVSCSGSMQPPLLPSAHTQLCGLLWTEVGCMEQLISCSAGIKGEARIRAQSSAPDLDALCSLNSMLPIFSSALPDLQPVKLSLWCYCIWHNLGVALRLLDSMLAQDQGRGRCFVNKLSFPTFLSWAHCGAHLCWQPLFSFDYLYFTMW